MIDIPGYRIVRALGRGGMASVYLAIQESVQREVALKIMSPSLLGDPQFGERFLREARIAAKLRHPNVVQVHDVGVAADHHYMAMEFLSGGPVIVRDEPPRGLRHALKVTREIAAALGYAHARGVIHRDIKPDNMLLREDGVAVLTDFGIARASDNVRMTMTGSIMGTPSYMSPEQARGVELDGRSDLYSLGIVFYELLTGAVPYSATDQLSVGIMHITAPVPTLPQDLAWLQPLMNRLLAKEPPLRFQNGVDLAQALADIEQGMTPTPVRTRFNTPTEFPSSGLAPTSAAPLPPRAASLPAQSPAPAPVYSAEPTMGHVDADLLRDPRSRRSREHSTDAAPRRWPWGVVLILAVLAAGLWGFQDRLRALLPKTDTEQHLITAERALAEGRLLSEGEQRGAQDMFEAILALDGENARARLGLTRVGEAWLARADQALQNEDLAGAEAAIEHAKQIVPAARLESLQARVAGMRGRQGDLEAVLQQANAARSAGRLDGSADSALALYGEVLKIDPSNAIASDGIGRVLEVMLAEARRAMETGDFDTAQARLQRVQQIEPAHPDLPGAQASLAAAMQSQQSDQSEALESALTAAEALLKRGRLTAPRGDNAVEAYRAILREHPGEARAQAGLDRIASSLRAQFDRAVADFQIDKATDLFESMQAAGVSSARLSEAEARLDTARRRQQALDRSLAEAADPARLQRLLDEADTAVAAGQLFAPPGDSAYDKYRQVQSADPNNARARQGVLQLPAQARLRFEEAMKGNRLGPARGYVEGLESFKSDDPALPGMKHRLAQSYVGFAQERLQAGEISRAQQALDFARELDPDNPELISLRARLEQAGGR